jgi:hypothetical protein
MFLKRQCQEICFRFFFMNLLPHKPENNIMVISNFFKNLQRYKKVHHRYQRHRWYHWVLLTPVANNGNIIRLRTP